MRMCRCSMPVNVAAFVRKSCLAGALAVSLICTVKACMICVPVPQKTLADHVMESRTVAFAREDPDSPFTYRIEEYVKGDSDGPRVDLFVDSTTRRQLKSDARRRTILCRADEKTPWRNLGVADPEHQQVVRRIVALSSTWRQQGSDDRSRFFLGLLGHKNRALSDLAYLELSRAPYDVVRRAAAWVSRDELDRLLERPEYIEWRPLAIMMLAQSDSPQDEKRITRAFAVHQQHSLTTNLAAWTTAYIEIKGEEAVHHVAKAYLTSDSRKPNEISAVLRALSIHGQHGSVQLRDAIARQYLQTIGNHPEAVGMIARDLLRWKKWEFRAPLRDLLAHREAPLSASAQRLVRAYLQSNHAIDQHSSPRKSTLP